MTKVTCPICGGKYFTLAGHSARRHGLPRKEFEKRYPDHPFETKRATEARRKNADSQWTPERRAAQAIRMRSVRKAPSRLKRQRQGLKRMWSDPERRDILCAKLSEAQRRIVSDPEELKRRSERVTEQWRNPRIRRRRLTGRRRFWASAKGNIRREAVRRESTERWQTEEHREKCRPLVDKWTKPEKTVRSWLRKLGVYQVHDREQIGFLPHRWLPTKGYGFSANGDFVDYTHRVVIQVDGYAHFKFDAVQRRDERLDQWCLDNNWLVLHLPADEIQKRPRRTQKRLRGFLGLILRIRTEDFR